VKYSELVKYTTKKIVKSASRLSIASKYPQLLPRAVITWRHLANDISLMQPNWIKQYYVHKHTKTHVTFDLDIQ